MLPVPDQSPTSFHSNPNEARSNYNLPLNRANKNMDWWGGSYEWGDQPSGFSATKLELIQMLKLRACDLACISY
jgi:hypothetical protein